VVLPGYETSFLARQPVDVLPDLPAHLEAALRRAGLETLGQLLAADAAVLVKAVGDGAAERLRAAAAGANEEPIAVAAPPAWIQEEAVVRSARPDRPTLEGLLDGLAVRALRRLRPFGLQAGTVTVDVRRRDRSHRRSESVHPGIADEATACGVVRALAEPLLDPSATVTALQVRLSRLTRPCPQAPLFPELGVASG
jgi:nucleotidyltransferase/DNA polymerase involved in DNA repair